MSSSKAYMTKKQELKEKEDLLLKTMDEGSEKIKKVFVWSLVVGLLALVGWGIFKSFSGKRPKGEGKKKKKSKQVPKDYPVVDSLIEQAAPKLGQWILDEFKTKR